MKITKYDLIAVGFMALTILGWELLRLCAWALYAMLH